MVGLDYQGRSQRLEALFEIAVELSSHDRASFLRRACAGQTTLRNELRRLLRANRPANGDTREPDRSARDLADSRPRGNRELALASGARVDHYELIRELGAGGMGAVFLARDTLDGGALVAIKFLSHCSSMSAARLRCEALITAQVSHNNIALLRDVGQHAGYPYLVLEYIEGKTLRSWLRFARLHQSRPGSPAARERTTRVVELMIPVVRALDYAHRRNVVHRDIKPENIMITASGSIKILDFGIAKLLEGMASPDVGQRATAAALGLTRTGALMGTMAYMAPEQWRSEPIDHRCDLWAVGVMLYEMAIGQHPLAPLSPDALMTVRDVSTPMPSAAQVRELGQLGRIIDWCLVKRRHDRVGTAAELLQALTRYLDDRLASEHVAEIRPHEDEAFSICLRAFRVSHAEAARALASAFGVSRQRAADIVQRAPITIKHGLPGDAARAYIRALTQVGAEVVATHEPSGATRRYRAMSTAPVDMPRRCDAADLTLYHAARPRRSFTEFCREQQTRSHSGCQCPEPDRRARIDGTGDAMHRGWLTAMCFAVLLPLALSLFDPLHMSSRGVLAALHGPWYMGLAALATGAYWLIAIGARLGCAWSVRVHCDACGYAIARPDPYARQQRRHARIEQLVQAGVIAAGPLLYAYMHGAAWFP